MYKKYSSLSTTRYIFHIEKLRTGIINFIAFIGTLYLQSKYLPLLKLTRIQRVQCVQPRIIWREARTFVHAKIV